VAKILVWIVIKNRWYLVV